MKSIAHIAFATGLLIGTFASFSHSGFHPSSPAASGLQWGTLLRVALIDPLSSENNVSGDVFLASLAEPVVSDGVSLLPAGTIVWGRVVSSVSAGNRRGRASLQLTLDAIGQNNRSVPIVTNVFAVGSPPESHDFETAHHETHKARFVRGKTLVPAGTLTSAALCSGVVLGRRTNEIYYPPETRLNFTLLNDVDF